MISEPISVTLLVCEVFERLKVPYLIGGSFASTVHGEVRTTLDSDVVAELNPQLIAQFIQELGTAFYADEGIIREAIARRGCFNVIHLQTMFKVDVFIPKARAFDREEMKRRTRHVVLTDPERIAYIATAEDTILAKLERRHPWRQNYGIQMLVLARLFASSRPTRFVTIRDLSFA